jgi:hypothetical protein
VPPNEQLHSAWTAWLSTFHWDHFSTLTFAEPRSEASARRAFAKYVRGLRQLTYGGSVGYFCGYEYGTYGRLHLHALMRTSTPQTVLGPGGVPRASSALPSEVVWRAWFDTFGRATVAPYDRKRGAAGYVSKYVTKRLAFYDLDNMVPVARDLLKGTK